MDAVTYRCIAVLASVKRLMEEEKLSDAIIQLKEILEVVPEGYMRIKLQGALMYASDQAGDFEVVKSSSAEILRAYPWDTCASFFHAKALAELKEYEDAAVELRFLIQDPRQKACQTFELIPVYLKQCTRTICAAAARRARAAARERRKNAGPPNEQIWKIGVGACLTAGISMIGYGLAQIFH